MKRKINKDTMVLGYFDIIPHKLRICLRNKWSKHFGDFPILTIYKMKWYERTEYKFGIIGFEFILMYFKDNLKNY